MRKLGCVVLAICLLPGAAIAQASKIWGESGRWVIRENPDGGNGCYMESRLEDGTVVQFGLIPDRDGGFFAAFHVDWNDITVGDTIAVKLDFAAKRFSGEAKGLTRGELLGGYAFFDNPNVLTEFAKNTTMTIIDDKDRTVAVDLTGTARAMQAIEACQQQQSN